MEAVSEGVLRRKVRILHKGQAATASPAEKGWRLALARALRDRARLEAEVTGTALSVMSLAEVVDMPPDPAMILMLDGPGEGLGVLILSAPVFTTVVEVLTLGRCAPQAPETRRATRVDAAMIAPLADAALSALEEALAEEAELGWAGGFRFASVLEDARPLGFLLEDGAYRVLRADLSLAGGARQGGVTLILPAQGRGRLPAARPDPGAVVGARADFAARFARQVEQAEVRLDAVIGRLAMPLAEAMALRPGQLLALEVASVDRIALCALDGRQVALCRLGQSRGMRALRLRVDDGGAVSVSSAADVTEESMTVPLPLAQTGTG